MARSASAYTGMMNFQMRRAILSVSEFRPGSSRARTTHEKQESETLL